MILRTWVCSGVAFALSVLGTACQSGGVGDPCIPEDEYQKTFSGYSTQEVNVESKSFQCETRLCLVNRFQGRVSCPYGQTEEQAAEPTTSDAKKQARYCHVPGQDDDSSRIQVAVPPQVVGRRPVDTVYCSCRCAGPDANAKYCECPSGYSCEQLVDPIAAITKGGQLAGSYCIKSGTLYVKGSEGAKCVATKPTEDPPGECGSWNGQE